MTYSESQDFDEKQAICTRMVEALSQFTGAQLSDYPLALEIGGSGGLLAGLVSNAGPKVICTDLTDVQMTYNGEFPRLLKEKFLRNGFDFSFNKVEFHTADAQDLPYRDEKFDLVFSLNAFEHIPDPIKALNEIGRVLRKGGVFWASFDPVWTADSGSHFFQYVNEPWLHLLVDDNEFRERMRLGGAAVWEVNEYPHAMNGLPARFFETEFRSSLESIFSITQVNSFSGCVSADHIKHPNHLRAAEKMGWELEELLIRGFQVIAIK